MISISWCFLIGDNFYVEIIYIFLLIWFEISLTEYMVSLFLYQSKMEELSPMQQTQKYCDLCLLYNFDYYFIFNY